MSPAPRPDADRRARPAGGVPMAELHCHIEGAAHPDLVRRLAKRYGIDLGDILAEDGYVWHDFTSFLAAYDRASTVFRSEEDFAELATDHLTRLAGAGTLYAEFFISPDHASLSGVAPEAYAAGLSTGIARARDATGIEARMIVVGVRHLGPEAVERAARFAAAPGRPDITGFGLAGDERIGAHADFRKAFDIARDAGLGLTIHAGEVCGADSVRAAIDAAAPHRIGHGVRAIEDEALVADIARRGIVLEVCPGSNLALGLYPDIASHPLKRLVEAGVKVTLGADDPPFFHTSLAAEYRLRRRSRHRRERPPRLHPHGDRGRLRGRAGPPAGCSTG